MAISAAALACLGSIGPGNVGAVIGVSGTGKSYVVKAADAKGYWPRRVVFDPYAALDRSEGSRGEHKEPWAGNLVSFRRLVERPDWLEADRLRLVVDPACAPSDHAGLGRRFHRLAEMCWEQRGIMLIAEEVALYGRHAVPMVMQIATGGRHARLGLLLLSQRWGRIPIDGREAVTHLVCFAQGGDEDLDALRRKGNEFVKHVRRLPAVPGREPAIWRQGTPPEA